VCVPIEYLQSLEDNLDGGCGSLWVLMGKEFLKSKIKGPTFAFSLSLSFKKEMFTHFGASVDMHHLHLGLWG
jgi:hypothetical protein